MKLLSVIIPLYNSAKWLPKCLESILNQDVAEEDLEIICVNDGSPDESEQIAKQYQSEYPALIMVLTQKNQGPSGARNTGMRAATGKYLCFVDPDDYVESNVFGGLLRQMEEQRLDVLRFDYQIVNEEYQPVKKRDFELEFDYTPCVISGAEFLANRLDIACNIWRYFYRTDTIIKNQIWCFTGDFFDDAPWLPLVLLKTTRLGICDTVVYNYLERSDSLVKSKDSRVMKKKNDGFLLLIRLLQEELRGIYGEEVRYPSMKMLSSVNIDAQLREQIALWYERMIAHASLSLLTNAAVYEPVLFSAYLEQLRELMVFPLSQHSASAGIKWKIWMFNCVPLTTAKLLQLKKSVLFCC